MAIDYRALAEKYGGVAVTEDDEEEKDSAIDYAELAAKYGGVAVVEPTQETPAPEQEPAQEKDEGLLERLGIELNVPSDDPRAKSHQAVQRYLHRPPPTGEAKRVKEEAARAREAGWKPIMERLQEDDDDDE